MKNARKSAAFRVDASAEIGTGHLMRCLTFADELAAYGTDVCFISRHMPDSLQHLVKQKGHCLVLIESTTETPVSRGRLAHSHWLGASQIDDAQACVRAMSEKIWDWLVVDHYALDAEWETALRATARHIVVIDDLADRVHNCDTLLDSNFYYDMAVRYIGKTPDHCQLLLGPNYALLRPEFREARAQVKHRVDQINRIIVFFGGIDKENHTACAIEAINKVGLKGIHVDIVIGALHPYKEEIELNCSTYGFVCHIQTNRIAELMAAADLAVGAGGSATWERCCLGLPTLALCVADNQRQQLIDAAVEGLVYAPMMQSDVASLIELHLQALKNNTPLRYMISHRGMAAVDGRGVLRLVGKLDCRGVGVRKATLDDSKLLFEWRNHPTIREVSRNTDQISWETHQKWFVAALNSSEKLLVIGHIRGVPIGVVRYDLEGKDAEVSIYLAPDAKGAGYGQELLSTAEHWLATMHVSITNIRAQVLGDNDLSKRLFIGAGYRIDSTYYSKRIQ